MGVNVTYGGDSIPRSPFSVAVAPSVDLSKVKVSGLADSEFKFCLRSPFHWIFHSIIACIRTVMMPVVALKGFHIHSEEMLPLYERMCSLLVWNGPRQRTALGKQPDAPPFLQPGQNFQITGTT